MKKSAIQFIQDHKHIDYCEAIIYKDGFIEYATPSHVEMLIRIADKPKVEINDLMPIWASPLLWLTEYTGCIPVWSQGYIKPESMTIDQYNALSLLIARNLVKEHNML